ncbi:PTS sugar transporter subunit IIA [Amphibacillus sp. Q70]|uniref:PTS sugar transporter subunit IIA n=1 Tax=Amphibacillus sp. Q70 TaxID=3453416 RepID=UPI003F864E1E
MVEVLIVTHGSLADGLIDTAKLIVGDISKVSGIGFKQGDDPEQLIKLIKEKINDTLKKNNQLLIFADLLGGSPSNKIAMCLNNMNEIDKVEAVVGVNLPMLLDTLMLCNVEHDVQKVKESCLKNGVEGIKDLKKIFGL